MGMMKFQLLPYTIPCYQSYSSSLHSPEHRPDDLELEGVEHGVVAVARREVEEGGVRGQLVAELRVAHRPHHRHEPAAPAAELHIPRQGGHVVPAPIRAQYCDI